MTGGRAVDALAAEWIKLRSVRSTYWTLLVTLGLTVAAAVMTARNTVALWPRLAPADRAGLDPLAIELAGLFATQVGFGVLGVLAIGSEYATGQIRTTLTAEPRRLRVLTAKMVAAGAVAFAVGELTAFAAFGAAQPIMAGRDLDMAVYAPGVPRALLAAGAFAVIVALIGLGLGAITRHTAGAVAGLFGLVFVAPLVTQALSEPWESRVEPYLLPNLGQQMYALRPEPLPAGVAAGWCAVYAAVALGLAAVLIVRRDA
ncbi:MAG TPA: ABC transporter permease [Streptosporangiaceae bacterium]|nr:ABC transporter permease [Streptosporangiaceae bacterium]